MNCGLCGRKLKGAKSVERGYGPVCYSRMFPGKVQRKSRKRCTNPLEDEHYIIPGQMELTDYIKEPGGKEVALW